MQIDSDPCNEVAFLCADILDQAPDGIIYADHEGIIRLWNLGAQTIFGYASTEVLGKSLDILIPERFRSAHWKGFHSAMATGQPLHAGRVLRTRSVHKNGSKLYVDLTFGIVKDAEGMIRGSVAMVRDATDQHASEVQNAS
jgi:PAS domain S-box-containing protein